MTKKRWLAIVGVLVFVVAAVSVTIAVRSGDGQDVIEASGTVEATEADLGFQ